MKWPKEITPGRWSTIALVGMAPSARPLIPHISPDTGLFMIAAAWNMPELPRQPDVCIEIHPTWLLSHPNYSPGLWDWLHYSHPFPIFTYKTEPTIPASVRYPLKQVRANFLWNVLRGPDARQVDYFTSSLDYLMALALAYEPERIEIYGFDMATDTEYRFQREGGSFWYGIAAGLGVEVWLPDDCPMLKSRLYSFEGSQWVQQRRLEELKEQMFAGMERASAKHAEMEAAAPVVDEAAPTPEQIEYFKHMDEVRDVFYIYSGAAQTLEQLIASSVVEGILTRQETERIRSEVIAGKNHHISRLNWFEGQVTSLKQGYLAAVKKKATKRAQLIEAELEAALADQNQARMDYFMHNGATQLLYHLIAECDLQADAEFKPVMDIVSIDMKGGSSTEAIAKAEPVAV